MIRCYVVCGAKRTHDMHNQYLLYKPTFSGKVIGTSFLGGELLYLCLVEVLLVDGNLESSVAAVVVVVAIVGDAASRLDDRPRFARTEAASKDARRRVGEGGDGA